MAQENPEASPEAMAALAKLADVISEPGSREGFRTDPAGTLRNAGGNPDDLPEGLLEHMGGLSNEHLQVVSDLCDKLVESGLAMEVPDGGRVCFL